VLDTNVLVSGFLSPSGPCGHIVRLTASGEFCLLHDGRILGEYRRVLSRREFGFDPEDLAAFLDLVETEGELVAARPLKAALADPHDARFIEVALAGKAEALVTGNLKHFPQKLLPLVPVISPRQLISGF
jgi:putative PIN family toxin of toxin-antitoxin system